MGDQMSTAGTLSPWWAENAPAHVAWHPRLDTLASVLRARGDGSTVRVVGMGGNVPGLLVTARTGDAWYVLSHPDGERVVWWETDDEDGEDCAAWGTSGQCIVALSQ